MEANPEGIRAYGTYLGAEAAYNLPTIENHAIDFGLKTDNVGGAAGMLLKPFGDAINEVARPAVEGVFHAFGWAMTELGDAFIDVADDIAGREEDNAHLFYQFKLGDEKSGDSKGADYYGPDGGSAFQIAEIGFKPPEADEGGDRDLTQYLRGPAADAIAVADWFLEKWDELAGEFGLPEIGEGDPPTFESLVIDPLLGDFNEITKNGNAWKSVLTDGLAEVIIQMGKNFQTLVDSHFWTGPAANAAQAFIEQYWSKVVKAAAEPLGDFLAEGFQKIAAALTQLAARLVNSIGEVLNDVIVNLIAKHVTKGQLGSLWEAAAAIVDTFLEIFKIDIDENTIVDVIERIVRVIGDIFEAYRTMKDLVESAKEYFQLFMELKGALEKIPEVETVSGAASFVKEVGGITKDSPGGEDFEKLEKGGAAYGEAEKKYKETEGRVNRLEEKHPGEAPPSPEEAAGEEGKHIRKDDYTPAQGPYVDEGDRPYIPKDGSGEVKHGSDFEAGTRR